MMEIESFDSPLPPHEVPGKNCACGIYACKTVDGMRHLLNGPFGFGRRVFGVIELSGKVCEHDSGYRAQHGRIVELFDSTKFDIQRIAARYDVPVVPAGDANAACACDPCEARRRERLMHSSTGQRNHWSNWRHSVLDQAYYRAGLRRGRAIDISPFPNLLSDHRRGR